MGALYPKDREIILNISCKDLFREKFGTMIFTLAHELGHWVLHVEDVTNMQIPLFEDDVFYCRSSQNKSPIEYQADLFAGCLLMPEEIVSPLIQDLLNEKSRITWGHLYNIAKDFRVSISALTTRLQQLNLLYIDIGKHPSSKLEAMLRLGQITAKEIADISYIIKNDPPDFEDIRLESLIAGCREALLK